MALVRERAETDDIPGAQGLGGVAHPLVLGHDVPGPSAQHGVVDGVDVGRRGGAHRADQRLGGLALRPPLGVPRPGERALLSRVHDAHLEAVGQGDVRALEGVAVEDEGVAVAAGRRRQLVEDPAGDPGGPLLGALAGRPAPSTSSGSWPRASATAT